MIRAAASITYPLLVQLLFVSVLYNNIILAQLAALMSESVSRTNNST